MSDASRAVWVDEDLKEEPRDIYDITKQTAEQLCRDFFDKEGLQTSVYRVGRFLAEEPNVAANHRLYRGLDERDGAHALYLGLIHDFANFEVFNIASTSPFCPDDAACLKKDPEQAILRLYPWANDAYKQLGWKFPDSIDRFYAVGKAKKLLGYQPRYTFDKLLREAMQLKTSNRFNNDAAAESA